MRTPPIVAYTDGGCRCTTGQGGWGFVMIHTPSLATLERCGGASKTTNNRMELTAAIELLASLDHGQTVLILSDSRYLIDGATKWMPGWKRRNWIRRPKPLKNVDLFKALDAQMRRHVVSWRWVRGHSGNAGNERADALASLAMNQHTAGQAAPADIRSRWTDHVLPLT